MAAPVVNYVLIPFKGNINPGYPHWLKTFIKATKEIDKEAEKLDISVSNSKDIKDAFFILANKYVWGSLAFMVGTAAGSKNIFRQVEQIHISDIHHQVHVYFGLLGIGNVGNNVLPNYLEVTCSVNFCDKFYVRADIFEDQFCAIPNTIKIKIFKKIKNIGQA